MCRYLNLGSDLCAAGFSDNEGHDPLRPNDYVVRISGKRSKELKIRRKLQGISMEGDTQTPRAVYDLFFRIAGFEI